MSDEIEYVHVRIVGQFVVKYDGTVRMKRKVYDQFVTDPDAESILLDIANALVDGYTYDFDLDEFEIVEQTP